MNSVIRTGVRFAPGGLRSTGAARDRRAAQPAPMHEGLSAICIRTTTDFDDPRHSLKRKIVTGRQLRLNVPDVEIAERRVAGVAAIAHTAAAAERRGVHDLWIDIGNNRILSGAAVADIRRAAPTLRVESGNGEGGEPITSVDFEIPSTMDILRATAKASDGPISRWINRPISRQISRLLLCVPGVLPWHATLATAVAGVAMLAGFLAGGHAGLVAGALLFQTASVIDGVDGEIARATYRSSARGAVLDTTVDMLTNVAFFVGMTVALTRVYGNGQAVAGCCALLLMLMGLAIMTWLARRLDSPGNFNFVKNFYCTRFPTGPAAAVTRMLVTITSRDFFAFLIAIVVLLGGGWLVPSALAMFAAIWCGLVLLAIRPILYSSCGRPFPSLGREIVNPA